MTLCFKIWNVNVLLSFIFLVLGKCDNFLAVNRKSKEYIDATLNIKLALPFHPSVKENHITVGKSHVIGNNGDHYFFFAFDKSIDKFVSSTMLDTGGMWEPELLDLFKYLWENDKDHRHYPVIDAGANLGSFTLFAASMGAEIWSFEMQPLICTLLNASIILSKYTNRIHLYNVPLWSSNKTLSFSPIYENHGNTTAIEGKNKGTYSVVANVLDDFFPKDEIFFLKIDVEGAEFHVLQGFHLHMRKRKVLHLVFEFRAGQQEILRRFYHQGYRCRFYARHSNAKCRGATFTAACFWKSYRQAMDQMRVKFPRMADLGKQQDYADIYCRHSLLGMITTP
eukprot:gene7671-15703_t